MNRINFIHNGIHVSFVVQHVKFLLKLDLPHYWCINRCVYQFINKISDSQYREENSGSTRIEIDDEALTKYDELFWVNHEYSLEEDLKMGSKSLAMKYCIAKLKKELLSDEMLQLDAMMKLLASIISNEEISFEANEINHKSLLKLLNMSIYKDDCSINGLDISYEEIILLQLKMIQECIDNSKRYIIVLDCMFLTSQIRLMIEGMKNCIVVCICHTKNTTLTDYLYITDTDLEDDEKLYERMMTMSNFFDLNDYKKHLKAELNKTVS